MEWVERLNQSMKYIEEHLTAWTDCLLLHLSLSENVYLYGGHYSGRVYPKKKNVFGSSRFAGRE